MRVLVTGAGGQVGTEVARELAGRAEVVALDRAALDLADPDALVRRVREHRPQVIVNAAAYTAVDRAESEEAAALAVNGVAPGILAEEAKRCDAVLVHYSTDYVFDGSKAGAYVEDDPVSPVNAYGRTKLEGERRIAASGCAHVILRTEWVYGPHGKNFMLTMLKLAATRPELRVVDDQHGAPTSSRQLARLTRELLEGPQADVAPALEGAEAEVAPAKAGAPLLLSAKALPRLREASGVYHATADGVTTWCGFARAIFEARARREPSFHPPKLHPIASSEYPTPAKRPANSVLSNAKLERAFGTRIGDWRAGLEDSLSAFLGAG